MHTIYLVILLTGLIAITFFIINPTSYAVEGTLETRSNTLMTEKPEGYPMATLAGGCFWCLESEFRELDGVLFTQVGYAGGSLENPTYQGVSTGKTGHAETTEITYDPDKISYTQLIKHFLTKAHDPTQLNRQGVDIGSQYRSIIFYHDEEQKNIAEEIIAKINAQNLYSGKIVTEIKPATKFWMGEDYHQQYYEKYEENNGEIHPRVLFKYKIKQLKGKSHL